MTGLDDMLIERLFSPAAGRLQHRLGVGQWRIAFECLNGHVTLYLAGTAFAIAGKGLRDAIFADLLAALSWLLIIDVVRRFAQRQAASSLGVQSARLGERGLRTILIALVPVSLCYVESWESGCYTVSLLLLAAHLYFKACDTPPPEMRRSFAFGSA